MNKFNIRSDLNSGYIYNFYHDKKEIIGELFCQYIGPLLKYIYDTALNKEWKLNRDAFANEINK